MREWDCDRCTGVARTGDDNPMTPLHTCGGMAGMTIPYKRVGERVDRKVVEREDYVGGEMVQLYGDGQRPVMHVKTVRDDGEDCTVFAPCVVAEARTHV